jgi:hypothetical protein
MKLAAIAIRDGSSEIIGRAAITQRFVADTAAIGWVK